MTGAEVAESMLRHYGIRDVKVVAGQGYLTDHYNPLTKTVSLSEPVYHERSIAAAAVAAHECGHAVQHATAYSMLQMRSALVPVVQISAGLQQFIQFARIDFGACGAFFTCRFVLLFAHIDFGIPESPFQSSDIIFQFLFQCPPC